MFRVKIYWLNVLILSMILFVTAASNTCLAKSLPREHDKNVIMRVNNAASHKIFSDKIQQILTDYNKPEKIKPQIYTSPDSIMGTATATPEQCVRYLLRVNPNPSISVSPQELVSYYYQEGSREGVRPDVAFAQALVETGFFRYGGTVTPDQNNYCGLGTTSTIVKGAYFPTSELGVRAHIQHLLAYASTNVPKEPIIDPRYSLVRSIYQTGTLKTWQDLNGRWAVPGDIYGQNILRIYQAILNS
ncbi:glucosaminidase domain-containing protein [Pectinatus frisingensis]|uniref:glucosaminidase domain-containing protein n=1 Tax=Pectinatus frisingensis TaxID=865 RepID=UPI001E2ED5AD|nr:glucosaminidase domain-containing protein [Pectinatus frisingensis]